MIMTKIKRTKEKVNNFLYDHYYLRATLHQAKGLFFAALAAFIFAFGFTSFITPGTSSEFPFKIVTGGISGLSQNVAKIFAIAGVELPDRIIEAMGYTVFNLPLLVFAFFKVGKRFALIVRFLQERREGFCIVNMDSHNVSPCCWVGSVYISFYYA